MAGNWKALAEVIGRYEAGAKRIGVSISRGGQPLFRHRAAEQFIAASTVKVPLMIELYRQVDRGERRLSDMIIVTEDMMAVGSGVLLHIHPGIALTLQDLIYLMVSISDNTATNILIDLAGMGRVNAAMHSLGMTDSNLGRPMKGRAAIDDEVENLATADDYVHAIDAILNGTVASAASCESMLDMLRKQQNRRRIARFLPESSDIVWGTKTGSVPNIANDVGFVRTQMSGVTIAIFTEGFALQVEAEEAIGTIAFQGIIAAGVLTRD